MQVPAFPLDRFVPYIGDERFDAFQRGADRTRRLLGERTVWNLNSTASGGGVAEMLHVLLAYERGMGLDVRWMVLPGNPRFFAITKYLHHLLHGSDPRPGAELDDHAVYDEVAKETAEELRRLLLPGDVVILHDPQTAGLIPLLVGEGVTTIWRCHIGADRENDATRRGWEFLEPYLTGADAYVFSRSDYIPTAPRLEPVVIVPPSIDPFAPKNQDLDAESVAAIVTRIGLIEQFDAGTPRFVRSDGSPGRVDRHARIVRHGGPTPIGAPLVVQVSRWDPLKDMTGVLHAFADHLDDDDIHLALVGPDPTSVSDDPEGVEVLAECEETWRRLPERLRRRIQLVCLPMDDVEENAVMVNAIQRFTTVVVQKSLAEGFGLTVTEAMWKARPIVASSVGGIPDQIDDGSHGVLVDPQDGQQFTAAVRSLLDEPERAMHLGANARTRVREQFLCDRHLSQYAELLDSLLT